MSGGSRSEGCGLCDERMFGFCRMIRHHAGSAWKDSLHTHVNLPFASIFFFLNLDVKIHFSIEEAKLLSRTFFSDSDVVKKILRLIKILIEISMQVHLE